MGRRGYVQKRQAEHDLNVCIRDWAQAAAVAYLEEKGINVCTGDSSGMSGPGNSDHWEIEIPTKRCGRGKNVRHVRDVGRMDRIIADLRRHPGRVKSGRSAGSEYGEQLAAILEVGMKVAEKHDYGWIMVDFW